MASSVRVLDEAIKEYLLFRGFADTLRAFEADIKGDREKGFQVDRVVGHLLGCATAHAPSARSSRTQRGVYGCCVFVAWFL